MKKKINFYIKEDTLKNLDKQAKDEGLTRTALMVMLINNYLKGVRVNEKVK